MSISASVAAPEVSIVLRTSYLKVGSELLICEARKFTTFYIIFLKCEVIFFGSTTQVQWLLHFAVMGF